MKLMSLTVPVTIAALTVAAVGGLGTLAVRASAVSTQTNIELLRLNLRVAKLHEQLLQHSRDALAEQVQESLPRGSVPAAVAPVAGKESLKEKVFISPEEGSVQPWPEEVRP
jgi:hypothetical protein